MLRVLRRSVIPRPNTLLTRGRYFSSYEGGHLGRNGRSLSVVPFLIGVSTLSIGGFGIYLWRTDSMKIVSTAREVINSSEEEIHWHEAIANALIYCCSQDAGRKLLKKHNWGRTLGNWIKDHPE